MGVPKGGVRHENQGVAPPSDSRVPSVARGLHALEADALKAIALALPETWCVVVEPPYGQLAITPIAERRRFLRAWLASSAWGKITREPWRDPR